MAIIAGENRSPTLEPEWMFRIVSASSLLTCARDIRASCWRQHVAGSVVLVHYTTRLLLSATICRSIALRLGGRRAAKCVRASERATRCAAACACLHVCMCARVYTADAESGPLDCTARVAPCTLHRTRCTRARVQLRRARCTLRAAPCALHRARFAVRIPQRAAFVRVLPPCAHGAARCAPASAGLGGWVLRVSLRLRRSSGSSWS